VDTLDDQLIARMHQAGCRYLFCGLESASPEVLLAINKTEKPGEYLEYAIRAFDGLRRHGIPCSSFLIFGCPRRVQSNGSLEFKPETADDVERSLEFAVWDLDPDYLSMNVLRFLPGVPLSFAPQYEAVRPTGRQPVHGGYYDSAWYKRTKTTDLRSKHPIYRAFEGCGSVNPPNMTPQQCYDILTKAVDMVNAKNSVQGKRQTQMVVDVRFLEFLRESRSKGWRRYELTSLREIENRSEVASQKPRAQLGARHLYPVGV
jgi:hypothetical protein